MKARISPQFLKTLALWLGGATALVLVILYLAGAFNERIPPEGQQRPSGQGAPGPARKVKARLVEEEMIEQFPGTVRAIRETVISARITANVKDVLARSGGRVREGEPLLILDSRDLQAREQQARESLAAAEALFREAEVNFERMKSLLGTQAIARKTHDNAEAVYLTTRAAMERARRQVEEAQVNLTYASIRAPFEAIVVDRYVEPGDLAAPGVPLVKVYDPGKLRLEAFVRESVAVNLERGDELEVSLETLSLRLTGRVEEIVPQAEAGSRSFLVKVGLPPTERVYPGMFGRLLLPAGKRRRLLIPEAALSRVGQLTFVVLADAEHTRRVVTTGSTDAGGQAEILSGLAEGEEILVPVAE